VQINEELRQRASHYFGQCNYLITKNRQLSDSKAQLEKSSALKIDQLNEKLNELRFKNKQLQFSLSQQEKECKDYLKMQTEQFQCKFDTEIEVIKYPHKK
jgi:dsDNA-specific endonuclease/ATPase MutS2